MIETDYGRDFGEIQKSHIGGSSNAFLVEATNLKDVMNASRSAFTGYGSTDRPVKRRPFSPSRGEYWFVVFLGAGGSSPCKWIVDNVAIDDTRIQLAYRKSKAGYESMDMKKYFYWIPLGELRPGAYNVGLYDADLKTPTLTRRVVVADDL